MNACVWLKLMLSAAFVCAKQSSLVFDVTPGHRWAYTHFILFRTSSSYIDFSVSVGTEPNSPCRSARRGVWPIGQLVLQHREHGNMRTWEHENMGTLRMCPPIFSSFCSSPPSTMFPSLPVSSPSPRNTAASPFAVEFGRLASSTPCAHWIECLHIMRMMESHICTNRLRIHLESVHPFMKFGNDPWWRSTLTWNGCQMCCRSIQNNQKSKGFVSNFGWSMVQKKIRSPNYSARSPLTRDLSGVGCVELQNGEVFTTCW